MKNAIEVLKRAKERLTPERWIQRGPGGDQEHDCLVTAIMRGPFDDMDARYVASDAVRQFTDTIMSRWQDRPGRTLAEVHAVIDLAILSLEASEPV